MADDVCAEERGMHDFLDELDLNQTNFKECLENFRSRFRVPNIEISEGASPTFLLKRARAH